MHNLACLIVIVFATDVVSPLAPWWLPCLNLWYAMRNSVTSVMLRVHETTTAQKAIVQYASSEKMLHQTNPHGSTILLILSIYAQVYLNIHPFSMPFT